MKKFLMTYGIDLLVVLFVVGCIHKQYTTDTPQPEVTPVVTETPSPAPIPSVSPVPAPVPHALAWETPDKPERKVWSYALVQYIIEQKDKFDQAADLTDFCPKYKTLSENSQAEAIAELIVAVVFNESAYSPISRMKEGTLGTDCVTNKPVYSEGLLQLSYCDKTWAPFCRFDWNADKNLDPKDPKKTILDPFINLECGVGIMANQVVKKKAIAFTSGNYWATLRPNGKYGTVPDIKARVKKYAPFCF